MRILLALFAALLLLSVGSGATASTSTPPQNGLIAVQGAEGIYIVDPSAGTASSSQDPEDGRVRLVAGRDHACGFQVGRGRASSTTSTR